jgi:hypothetical protein
MEKVKKNPILEIEHEFIKNRYVVCRVGENKKLETTEKLMFDFINEVYNLGIKSVHNNKRNLCIIVGVLSFLAGIVLGILIMSLLVAK